MSAMTPEEARAYVEAAPDPLSGPPIWEAYGPKDEGYDMSARATAKAMLIVAEADPTLLEVPSKEDDPTGIERAFAAAHWKAAEDRWPGLDDWLGGITAFQFGWANNMVRYILGAEPVGNPAIVTVGKSE